MLIAFLLVFLIASETIVMDAFHTIEIQSAQKDTNRALSVLAADINQLDAVAQDWASRDTIKESILQENNQSLLAVLDDTTLDRLKFDYILFYNVSGGLITGKGYDADKKMEIPVPASFSTLPLAPAQFATIRSQGKGLIGIIAGQQDPLYIAVQPVYASGLSTTPTGYIVMAKYLDVAEIARLVNLVQLPLEVQNYNDPALPADYETAVTSFQNETAPFIRIQENDALIVNAPIYVAVLDHDTLGAYTLIRDINGSPLLVLRLTLPRDIYAEGRSTTVYFFVFLVIFGVAFGVIILLLLDESVLSRLLYVSNRVNSIGAARDFAARVSMAGTDEVSQLATDVNTMLAELERSQQYLKNRLDQREKSYHLFFNSISEPVLIWQFRDQEGYGELIEANDAAIRTLGYSRIELATMRPGDILAMESEVNQDYVTKQLILHGKVQFEGNYRTKQGTIIPVEVIAQTLDQYGEKAVLTITRDITERKDIERLKREAFQQIEENMQQFAVLNDQIRNPLQAIIGIADLTESAYKEKIIRLATTINEIVHKLDKGYIDSEKIREFLRKYYGIGKK